MKRHPQNPEQGPFQKRLHEAVDDALGSRGGLDPRDEAALSAGVGTGPDADERARILAAVLAGKPHPGRPVPPPRPELVRRHWRRRRIAQVAAVAAVVPLALLPLIGSLDDPIWKNTGALETERAFQVVFDPGDHYTVNNRNVAAAGHIKPRIREIVHEYHALRDDPALGALCRSALYHVRQMIDFPPQNPEPPEDLNLEATLAELRSGAATEATVRRSIAQIRYGLWALLHVRSMGIEGEVAWRVGVEENLGRILDGYLAPEVPAEATERSDDREPAESEPAEGKPAEGKLDEGKLDDSQTS